MSNRFLDLIGLATVLVILFVTSFYYSGQNNNYQASISDITNQQFLKDKGLFVDSKDDPKLESPDLYLIQKNSLMANCPPMTVTSQVLGTLGASTEEETRKAVIEYIVESGDSLSSIAEKFNVSLETVLWANDLTKTSKIQPGKKLIILPVTGLLHLVRQNDTLSEIAEKYKGDIEEIVAINNLSENGEIFIGDLLVIPNGKMPAKKTVYADTPLVSSYFIMPTQGTISQGLHWYNAIDVANKCGTSILAAAGGQVQKVGYNNWPAGNYVQILHPNGVVTFYGHFSKILVKTNEIVSQGQVIGYMGQTGLATGCHLHFDVRGAKNPLAKYPLGSKISWK